MNERMSDGVS